MALKVLILTPRIPYPLMDGGAIAMNQSLEGYIEQGCKVSLLSMNTSRHWVDEVTLPELYGQLSFYKSVYLNTNINPLSAFLNLFTEKSYNVTRFINREFEKELIYLLQHEDFDIIQFESIYTSPYLKTARKYSDAKCFCRVHNLEYLIWQRLAENEKSFLKQRYLNLLTNRLKNYELEIIQKFDLLLPISKTEENYLIKNKLNKCYYLPFGIGKLELPKISHFDTLSCFHVGSMDWAPNIEGVQWFLQNIWPEAQPKLKGVSLYLAGKNMPPSFLSRESENIHIVGEVENMNQFCLEKNIMIVPLLSGAGIRIKIIQAMSLGKTIISTGIGSDGIGATHLENIIIANTADEFINALIFCFEHVERAKEIGLNAQKFVISAYQKNKIYTDFIEEIRLKF